MNACNIIDEPKKAEAKTSAFLVELQAPLKRHYIWSL
jgi:hypothetical protein